LVADHAAPAPPIGRRLAASIIAGILVSVGLFTLLLGLRPDFYQAFGDPRFVLKFIVMLTLAITTAPLLVRLARPDTSIEARATALVAAPALLVAAVLGELASRPSDAWLAALVGSNALVCLTNVPLLAAPVLTFALASLRHGAPTRPGLAGAVGGLLAGALGATLYAAHCTDDSPLFVITWYSLAIGLVSLIGAAAGAKVLRW
jgi:hypothetical protein